MVKAATWLTHVELEQTSPFDRQLIETFARDFRLVTYDARGCGLSQRHVDDVSFEAWVRDLEAVADALALDTFRCWGYRKAQPWRSRTRLGIPSESVD